MVSCLMPSENGAPHVNLSARLVPVTHQCGACASMAGHSPLLATCLQVCPLVDCLQLCIPGYSWHMCSTSWHSLQPSPLR